MNIHSEKTGNYLLYIILLVEIVFLIIVGNSKYQDISFQSESLTKLNNNWTYTNPIGTEHTIQLPTRLSENGKVIAINRVIPDNAQSDWVLATLSSHKSIHAYLDNILLYSCEEEKNRPLDLTPGSMWNIIDLPMDAAGKTFTLEITSDQHNFMNVINEVYIGSKASFLIHIVQSSGINLGISLFILFMGLNLIIVYLLLVKILKKNKSILYLGLFSIFVSLWMIMESEMIQFYIENRYVITSLKYLSLMTLPIPILLYISMIDNNRFRKLILCMNFLFISNVIIMILLQAFNIFNFHDGLFILHILMVIIFSILFFLLCLEVFLYKNKSMRYLNVSFGFLFVFSMLEIISYNIKTKMYIGSFLQLGVLFFMIIVTWSSMQKVIDIIRLSENAKHYEYLATRDYMTNSKNRTAYTKELTLISLDQEIAVILTDINNMKYINDTYGHHAGDEVIINCSQCLSKTLGSIDRCYRIGGDEFVCIEFNKSKDHINEKIEAFIQECAKVNSTSPYLFEVSIGYAFYDNSIDHDIFDTVKRADKRMYKKKGGMKVDFI